ncbi:MAG: glycine cleavage system aminomethyltransferase GcvT [Deltaproteobacteria bacterium]
MNSASSLKTTPLTEDHKKRAARMAPFAGWEMPIQYEGILAETLHTRRSVSCFDICHMGEFFIEGAAAGEALERCITARLADLAAGSCRYASILNEDGGVIDDLIVYRRAPASWMIVVNAARVEKDKEFFGRRLPAEARFRDASEELGKIDVQGPRSREVLASFLPAAARLKYYTFIETRLAGAPVTVSRTGYTGELGFEIYLPLEKVPALWDRLLADPRARPAGLGARDILRLEMGYSLYGQDIDEGTTPLEAGLERFVDLDKDFAGRPALLRQKKEGIRQRRVFFASRSRRAPRHGHRIFLGDKAVGTVTSGTFSPHLGAGIGMGFTAAPLADGRGIGIGEATPLFEAAVCAAPFVTKTSLRT